MLQFLLGELRCPLGELVEPRQGGMCGGQVSLGMFPLMQSVLLQADQADQGPEA